MGSQDRQRETPDDLSVLLAALPPEIVEAIHALPDRESLIEVVLDLGRRPEARYPRPRGRAPRARDRRRGPAVRRGAHRLVRRRQPGRHRADAPPDQRDPQPERQGRRPDLPDRAGGVRDDRDHRGLHRDREVDPDHGPPGHRQDDDAPRGRPRPRRRAAQARRRRRHLERDRGRRRHPAPGHRQGAPDAGPDAEPPARGDDRGGREPHAPGHRHRRDRDGARGAGRPHDRRARRPADRHRARQQPRQPDAQPDAVGPHRRHPERDPGRRGGAPPALAEERPRAQAAADVRRHRRDPGPRAGARPRRRRPRPSTRCSSASPSRPSSAGATRRASIARSRDPSRPRGRPSAGDRFSGLTGSGAGAWGRDPGWRGAGSYRTGGYAGEDRLPQRPGYRPGRVGRLAIGGSGLRPDRAWGTRPGGRPIGLGGGDPRGAVRRYPQHPVRRR